MMTLRKFSAEPSTIPTITSWYLADLSKAQGKQELFTHQSPQKLKILREHALIESAISSNRIEGVNVDHSRINTLILGKPFLKDRDEEEVRGYRDVLHLIHEKAGEILVSEETILKFHKLSRGQIWDAGKYKEKDINIIQKYPDGRQRVRFETVPADQTPPAMSEMIELWSRGLQERWVHPFVLLAALNLDFLCIHPFRDGNGRVSRLLFLLTCYHSGLEAGRYISLERLIEQNKERYYETLEQSSLGWHEGKHDPWPFINYILSILKYAYREFEDRVDQLKSPRGAKTEQVEAAVKAFSGTFTLHELERACMGVSRDMVRKVLRNLQKAGFVECLGRGPGAVWQKKGNTLKKG
ncbi:MAG: Fic family protein [Deltaproteobacteria bacterium]|nr:Fic family protein [Deltaproteobacteria bacterium]